MILAVLFYVCCFLHICFQPPLTTVFFLFGVSSSIPPSLVGLSLPWYLHPLTAWKTRAEPALNLDSLSDKLQMHHRQHQNGSQHEPIHMYISDRLVELLLWFLVFGFCLFDFLPVFHLILSLLYWSHRFPSSSACLVHTYLPHGPGDTRGVSNLQQLRFLGCRRDASNIRLRRSSVWL